MITVIIILISIGLFFNLMSVLGLIRFPDAYTRLHASTKCTTFGALFVILGIILYYAVMEYEGALSLTIILHSGVAFLFIVFTNPIGSHAIARGAHKFGIKPYGAEIDDLDPRKRNIAEKTVSKSDESEEGEENK
jgi:multicomponent Na+:H+ antiporter subunit G